MSTSYSVLVDMYYNMHLLEYMPLQLFNYSFMSIVPIHLDNLQHQFFDMHYMFHLNSYKVYMMLSLLHFMLMVQQDIHLLNMSLFHVRHISHIYNHYQNLMLQIHYTSVHCYMSLSVHWHYMYQDSMRCSFYNMLTMNYDLLFHKVRYIHY